MIVEQTSPLTKPRIRYVGMAFGSKLEHGQRALVYIIDRHPVLGNVPAPKWVNTSEVQEVHENGDFETLNTVYVKTAILDSPVFVSLE
jgi:hypothetical protein